MESHFLAYLYRLRHIERWSLMRNTTRENVAEHSYHVALLTHLLCEIGNRVFGRRLNADRAAAMALFHDATEVFTGDIPTPVKHHNPRMLDSFREIEALAAERLAAMVPEPLREAYAPLLTGKTWQRSESGADASGGENAARDVDRNEAGNGNSDDSQPGDEMRNGSQSRNSEDTQPCDDMRISSQSRNSEDSQPGVDMRVGDRNGSVIRNIDDTDAELRKYLKAADLLDAYLKCTVELASGNREFAVAFRQIKASLDRLALPEAEWFLERFAPSFSKTLDELSGET